MFYGRSGIGKTAVCWQIAQAIQAGSPIWGFPTAQTNVLFLELDTPEPLVQDRWQNGDPPFEPNFTIVFEETSYDYRQFLTPYPDEFHGKVMHDLQRLHRELQFGVVFVDALREVVLGDLSVSGTPRRVYDAFKTLFPGATVVFIHHERKSSMNPMMANDPLHAAAGSMEFINVAQVALQFHKKGRDTWLEHRKSQASAEFEPLPISLREDGVHVFHRHEERFKVAEEIISRNPEKGMRELDKLIGAEFGISDRSARVIRLGLMQRRKDGDEASEQSERNTTGAATAGNISMPVGETSVGPASGERGVTGSSETLSAGAEPGSPTDRSV